MRGRSPSERRILETLVSRGILTELDCAEVYRRVIEEGGDYESILLDQYRVPDLVLGDALGSYHRCPYLPVDQFPLVDRNLLAHLSIDYLRAHSWVPLRKSGNAIEILTNDPADLTRELDIRRAFPKMTIRFVVGLRRDIEHFLLLTTESAAPASSHQTLGELVRDAEWDEEQEDIRYEIDENNSAIVRLASQIISEAYRIGASDIHIEPSAHRRETAVRLRVDGNCCTYMKIPSMYRRPIVSRIKIMANLDIAECRKPQDGKIRFKISHDKDLEIRVATLPTTGGNEDVVLRLLTAKEPMPLDAMNFASSTLQAVKGLAERPYGIILCVGPTGSGKTTTLHAILKHINTDQRKIWTAEDPVEITQEGLRQLQVHPKIGLTFAAAMRAFLRADPDVIMIGEMRDRETADIAIEASLTGHLVLSTLHTNSAVETVTRLLDLGCDPFNFADSMLGVLAQRLCRRICDQCREPYRPTMQEYEELLLGYGSSSKHHVESYDNLVLYQGRGCDACGGTGFKGRVALHELLLATNEVKQLVQARGRTSELLLLALQEGMKTLMQDGIEKVVAGLTTYKQVRVVAMR